MGVKQVLAVTMDEARNATHFGDVESVRGVAMCAAFTIGTVMGGRRRICELFSNTSSHHELFMNTQVKNGNMLELIENSNELFETC